MSTKSCSSLILEWSKTAIYAQSIAPFSPFMRACLDALDLVPGLSAPKLHNRNRQRFPRWKSQIARNPAERKAKSGNLNLFLCTLPFFHCKIQGKQGKKGKMRRKRFRLPDFALRRGFGLRHRSPKSQIASDFPSHP